MSYEFQKPIRYTLDSAFLREEIDVDCNRIDIIKASSLEALITLTIYLENGDKIEDIELAKSGYFESPEKIKRLILVSTAQSGEWVDLRFSHTANLPERYDYKRGADDAIDQIGAVDSVTAITNPVKEAGAANFAWGEQSVGTSAVELSAVNTLRRSITVTNKHASVSVYIGNSSGVTSSGASKGFELEAGETIPISTTSAIHAIVASGTVDIKFYEEVN